MQDLYMSFLIERLIIFDYVSGEVTYLFSIEAITVQSIEVVCLMDKIKAVKK